MCLSVNISGEIKGADRRGHEEIVRRTYLVLFTLVVYSGYLIL